MYNASDNLPLLIWRTSPLSSTSLLRTQWVLGKLIFLFLPSFPFLSLYPGASELVSNHSPTLTVGGSLVAGLRRVLKLSLG